MIRFADLFSGIGGIRLGAEQAFAELGLDCHCVFSSEIDQKACETYAANFGERPFGDIHTLGIACPIDLLLAGFPCQPFSYAGRHKGFGDTRGTLFFEVERILAERHPRTFLLENVRGLMSHDRGRTLATILSRLTALGYGTRVFLLNSSDFGVPQNRVRLYIVGLLGAEPAMSLKSHPGARDSHNYKAMTAQCSLFERTQRRVVRDILEPAVEESYYCSESFASMLRAFSGPDLSRLHGYRLIDYRGGKSLHSWELGVKGKCGPEEIRFMNLLIRNRRRHTFGTHRDGKELTREQISTFYEGNFEKVAGSLVQKGYLREIRGRYNPTCGNMSFEVFKFLDPDSISITLTSADSDRLGVIMDNRPRRITPRECARLQGFPDSFTPHPDERAAYRQFGNSVSVPVIAAVIKDLFTHNAV